MRGKVNDLIDCNRDTGITPAYAGKRFSDCQPRGRSWDHPRVCGEKVDGQLQFYGWVGSPPRMRGKDGATEYPGLRRGITPAYAGKREPW